MASHTVVVGKWGGPGGSAWDDGSYTGVRRIEISYKDAIGTFHVIYDLNGKPFDGPIHPSTLPYTKAKIELDFPHEHIVSVSGHTAPLPLLATNTPVIRSLTFKTNKRIFGPYGVEEGTPFNLTIDKGFIVGFIGRSGDVLDAIGFHLAL